MPDAIKIQINYSDFSEGSSNTYTIGTDAVFPARGAQIAAICNLITPFVCSDSPAYIQIQVGDSSNLARFGTFDGQNFTPAQDYQNDPISYTADTEIKVTVSMPPSFAASSMSAGFMVAYIGFLQLPS